jgi:MoxR-like ATPase
MPLAYFRQLHQSLTDRFPERDHVIRGALAAILAGEHVLLLGPPGTAKSAIARAIAQAFDATYFERLLTKFSTPEELFGPISLKALESDRYARVTTRQLPEAEFAFVDEIWKANSAILNALLTIVNERLFHNDSAAQPCPLISLFGASNELPEGKELEALFDRFLLRFEVQYLHQPRHMRSILLAPEPTVPLRLSLAILTEAQKAAAAVAVTDPTIDALLAIRDACQAEGIAVSDRRWKKTLRLVQANAFLAGEAATSPEDLMVLSDCLWRDPKERPKVARLVGQLADPVSAQCAEILDAAREVAQRVTGLRTTDKSNYLTQSAKALQDFKDQGRRLRDLRQGAHPRAAHNIDAAAAEIDQLHKDLARTISSGLGLGGAR